MKEVVFVSYVGGEVGDFMYAPYCAFAPNKNERLSELSFIHADMLMNSTTEKRMATMA